MPENFPVFVLLNEADDSGSCKNGKAECQARCGKQQTVRAFDVFGLDGAERIAEEGLVFDAAFVLCRPCQLDAQSAGAGR